MNFVRTIIVLIGYLRNSATIIIAFAGSLILQIIGRAGYVGVFLLMTLESAAVPIPSEIIMPFSGFLAARGVFNFWLVVFAGTLGNAAGSLALYWVGEYGGRPFIKRWGRWLLLEDSHIIKAEEWFKKYGDATIFFSRMLPVARTYISFPAGVARVNLWKFNFYTAAGSFPWVLLLAYMGFKLGERWHILEAYFRKFDIVILAAGTILVLWFLIKYARRDMPENILSS